MGFCKERKKDSKGVVLCFVGTSEFEKFSILCFEGYMGKLSKIIIPNVDEINFKVKEHNRGLI